MSWEDKRRWAGQLTEIAHWPSAKRLFLFKWDISFQNLSKYSKDHLNFPSPSYNDLICLRYYYFRLFCKPTGSRTSFFHGKLIHRVSVISEQLF